MTLDVCFFGLAVDAVTKDDISKFQEGRNYILLTGAHLALHHDFLFFTSLI